MTPPSKTYIVLKGAEYADQQIAASPAMGILVVTLNSKLWFMATREAPYAGSVITARESSPRKFMLKSTRSSAGRLMTGVVDMEPSRWTG